MSPCSLKKTSLTFRSTAIEKCNYFAILFESRDWSGGTGPDRAGFTKKCGAHFKLEYLLPNKNGKSKQSIFGSQSLISFSSRLFPERIERGRREVPSSHGRQRRTRQRKVVADLPGDNFIMSIVLQPFSKSSPRARLLKTRLDIPVPQI